ncbi:MAG: hypothetical protein H6767_07065 [Candidatus Peribacteria bacterium]|nr:MAG: hypothetical protein H6767_07065 [Candidatus Peribacteria bacterium]
MSNNTTTTNNVLTINGAVYGNMTELLEKRTYIKDNANGQIDVGTIVSFGSSFFRKPAPLLGEFIGEYLSSRKYAD